MSNNDRKGRSRVRRKAAPRPESLKQDLVARLSRAEGQLRGLQRMIEQQAYCIDVLQQLSAVRRALDKLALLLVKDHLSSCAAEALTRHDGQGERKLEELIQTLDRFLS